jgi:predicted HTH domain antitoxin
MRTDVAIEMYRYEYVTLSRAAEIVAMNRWAFLSLLKERGVTILNPVDASPTLDEALNSYRSALTVCRP